MADPTAPDPLGCLNSRAAAEVPTCGEPDSAHCESCGTCPGNCVCPPASPWTKGDRVHVTYDAVYYAEPSLKPDQYALVVLPGTNLDDNVLITNRFRVPLTAMTRLGDAAPRDEEPLALALDAYAQHAGGTGWKTFSGRVPQHVADNAYECVAAGAAPLLAEIRRLTAEVETLKHSKETS